MPDNVMTEIVEHQTPQQKEAQGLAAEAAKSQKAAENKQSLENLQKALAHMEAQTLSGAPSLMPKELILDLSSLAEKHPDMHFRWVNIRAPGVADRRRLEGYLRLPESEGGRELGGELAVFVTTQRVHEHHVARNEKITKERLEAHKADVERVAESIVKELRDKHGIKIPLDRLMVDEG